MSSRIVQIGKKKLRAGHVYLDLELSGFFKRPKWI